MFYDDFDGGPEDALGLCVHGRFEQDGEPVECNLILLNVSQTLEEMIETLAHELAHAAVGLESPPHDHPHAHGPAWQKEFEAIQAEYRNRLRVTPFEWRDGNLKVNSNEFPLEYLKDIIS